LHSFCLSFILFVLIWLGFALIYFAFNLFFHLSKCVFVCVFPAIYCALHSYFEFSISQITNTFFSLCSAYILQICTYSFIFIFFRCFFFFGRPVLQLFLMLFCFGFVLACALFRERVSKRERVGFSFFFLHAICHAHKNNNNKKNFTVERVLFSAVLQLRYSPTHTHTRTGRQ